MAWFQRLFGGPPKPLRPGVGPGNPGQGHIVRSANSDGVESWTEDLNLVMIASQILADADHSVKPRESWLELPEFDLRIEPQIVDIVPMETGAVRTVTTIRVQHPTLIPNGLFEYQHAAGQTLKESLESGFDNWRQLDLLTLLDALRDKPQNCTMLEMEFPASASAPPRVRRVILGPVMHYQANPPAGAVEDEHPFCPCCLLTNSMEAFMSAFEVNDTFGIRFFASRDENGQPQADCRVNGEDWEPGMAALRKYVRTWPGSGFEFRKQYVVMRSVTR